MLVSPPAARHTGGLCTATFFFPGGTVIASIGAGGTGLKTGSHFHCCVVKHVKTCV